MTDQDLFIAINIVYTHWINPCQKIKLKALKKIQRFCRRGSGSHAYHDMICNKAKWNYGLGGPPVLYRQVCECSDGECTRIPNRIYNKHKRMQYAIQKIFRSYKKNEGIIDNNITLHKSIDENVLNKYYISLKHCFCNNKPFSTYKRMVSHPRGNFTTRDCLIYIMCELSGDELTYHTRFKLSNYLRHRLS